MIGENIRKKWHQSSFRTQMLIIYGGIITAVGVCLLAFFVLVVNGANKAQREILIQSVLSEVSQKLDSALEHADEYSKIIAFSSDVQEYLKSDNADAVASDKEIIDSTTVSLLVGNGLINSVYIYDLNDNYYSATDNLWRVSMNDRLENTGWFESVKAAGGAGIFTDDEDGFFGGESNKGIIFARVINDTAGFEPIGYLIMNIRYDDILGTDGDLQTGVAEDTRDTLWCLIYDDKGVRAGTADPGANDIFEISDSAVRMVIAGTEYEGRSMDYGNGFRIVAVGKKTGIFASGSGNLIWLALIFAAEIICLMLFTWRFELGLRVPLEAVLNAIRNTDAEEDLEKIEVISANSEMTELQEGYNSLVERLGRLFDDIEEEQRQKRKYELDVLNAQVRPHFLYNTFDSVCALALMGRTDDVYKLMQALGKYYRGSLHKGDEMISLGEEISIIVNYAVIQAYRFGDVFKIKYEVDEELKKIPVLKLILQPFVENAIYHGLKTKEGGGTITIRAELSGDTLLLGVKDDGVGMSKEQIDNVMRGIVSDEEKSFGVHKTIERISLHYSVADPVTIISEPGSFTEILIRLPAVRRGKEDSNAQTHDSGR